MKVRDRSDRLAAAGAAVLFVVHDDPVRIRNQLLRDVGEVPFPILVDRSRQAYAQWGLTRTAWWRVWLDPKVWAQYVALLTSGHRLAASVEDVLQLGGDFVVDRNGTIAYARPQRRDDRPPVGTLLSIIEQLAGR